MKLNSDDDASSQILMSYKSYGLIGSSVLKPYSAHHMPAINIFYLPSHFNNLGPHCAFERMSVALRAQTWAILWSQHTRIIGLTRTGICHLVTAILSGVSNLITFCWNFRGSRVMGLAVLCISKIFSIGSDLEAIRSSISKVSVAGT
jgi:hypothetical protein